MDSKIAVLIPTYGPSTYLRQCLDSLERQTLSKTLFKVYVLHNGPIVPHSDNIVEILNSVTFEWEYFYSFELGVSRARNNLISMSIEPYIAFIDDDDYVSNSYLEALLNEIDQGSIVVSNIVDFDASGVLHQNYIAAGSSRLDSKGINLFRHRKYLNTTTAKLMCRTEISGVQFNPSLNKGEDSIYMASVSNRLKRVKFTPSNVYYYVRIREDSLSRRKFKVNVELRCAMLQILSLISLFSIRSNNKLVFLKILAVLKKFFILLFRVRGGRAGR